MAIPQSRYVSASGSASAAEVARLTQEIRQIQAVLSGHIGAGGAAHRAANELSAGFLSVADRARYEAAAAAQTEADGDTLANAGIFTGASHGVIGGVGVDESGRILDAINALGEFGGHLVIRAATPGDPIYINAPIPVETSNLTLDFRSPLLYGPDAYVRINGGLQEVQRAGMVNNNLSLRAASTVDGDGRMVLPLRTGEGAFLVVGDRIVVRGENDKYGKAFTKQVTSVLTIVGDDVTCADEPDETFLPTYPDSDWPSDVTTGTTISIAAFSALAVDAQPGDLTVQVASTEFFTVGALCYINDLRTEADMMLPVVSTLRSQANMEIARLVAVDAGTNTLTFDRPLLRHFPTAWDAGVTVMAPVRNTHIKAQSISWDAPQPDRRNSCLAINYSDACTITAQIDGIDGRIGAAVRVGYSYDCHVLRTRAHDAYSFLSAEGYGLTLYYSTLCSIRDSLVTGCRHNYLVQTCTLWEIADNYSGDDFISGIDVHGANSVGGRITRNIVTRSNRHSPGVTNGGGIRNGNTSHTLGDHDTIIEDNWVIGYVGDLHCAIDVSPSSRNAIVQRNTILDSQIGFRHYKVGSSITPAQHSDKVTFTGNRLVRVQELFDIENYDGNSYWDEFFFTDNVALDCPGGFVVWDIPKVIAKGNEVINGSAEFAFDFRGIADLRVYGNMADGGSNGCRVANCGTAKIVRNWFDDVTGIPVVNGGGNGTFIASANDSTGGDGVGLLFDGGAFGDSTTFTIDGGAFGDSTGTTYDGGTF